MAPQSVAMSTPKLIVRPCTFASAHDGDTFRVHVPLDAGIPGLPWTPDIRLAHVNAPELSTDLGKAAYAKLLEWFTKVTTFTLLIYGPDKYGRTVADVQLSNGQYLSDFMLTTEGTVPMGIHRMLAAPR